LIKSRAGFTLIELLVVLTIMALVFMIAVPRIGFVSAKTEIRSGARQLAAVLREARSRAILSNQDVLFSLDVERRAFSISGDKGSRALSKNVDLLLYTAQQERVDKAAGHIRFFPDGTSTGGHVVLSGGNASYKVTVDWLTGGVEIQDVKADAK
jgi:general secretion pathway protein H